MLELHTSKNYSELFNIAKNIVDTKESVFDSGCIVVPNQATKKWLQERFVNSDGVCAQIDFEMNRSFYWNLLMNISDGGVTQYSSDSIRWHIWDMINNNESFAFLKKSTPLESFNFVDKLAGIYLSYIDAAPSMILGWENNSSSEDGVAQWQSNMWREINKRISCASPVGLLSEADFSAVKLNSDIIVFGVEQFSEFQIGILHALSRYVNVHIMITNPSVHFWFDVKSKRKINYDLVFNPEVAYLNNAGNPLISSFGYAKMSVLDKMLDLNCDLGGGDNISSIPCTLLESVRDDVHNLVPLATEFAVDDSIVLNACHSKLRETEIAFDTILSSITTNPGLLPEDFLVVAPDISEYILPINRAFSSPVDDYGQKVPYFIHTHNNDEQSYFRSLIQIMKSLSGEMSASEIFDILSLKHVSANFGFSESDLGRINRWISDTNIRCFYSGHHKESLGFDNNISNTWAFGKNRWIAGYICGECDDVDYLPSYGKLGGQDDLFERLFDFLDKWYSNYQVANTVLSPEKWHAFIMGICADFLQGDGIGEYEYNANKILNEVLKVRVGEYELSLPLVVICQILESSLLCDEYSYSGKIGVRFQSWKDACVEDAKVLIVMGMTPDQFPRNIPRYDFDLLQGKTPRLNRNVNAADKNLMLSALCSKCEKLVFTYIGYDKLSNKPLPPSSVVDDLISYLRQKTKGRFEVRNHYMHGFNHNYFSLNNKSFIKHNYILAQSFYAAKTNKKQPGISQIQCDVIHQVNIEQLKKFFVDPVDYYLNNHARLQPKVYFDSLKDKESYEIDSLERWNLSNVVFNSGKSAAMKTGIVAGGHAGNSVLSSIEFEQSQLKMVADSIVMRVHEINLTHGEFNINGNITLDQNLEKNKVHVGKLSSKHITSYWIEHLCCSPELPMIIYFQDKVLKFNPIENAFDILGVILQKWKDSFHAPWLFLPSHSIKMNKKPVLAKLHEYHNSLNNNYMGLASQGQLYFLNELIGYDSTPDANSIVSEIVDNLVVESY